MIVELVTMATPTPYDSCNPRFTKNSLLALESGSTLSLLPSVALMKHPCVLSSHTTRLNANKIIQLRE